MNIKAKELLKNLVLKVQEGIVADTVEAGLRAYDEVAKSSGSPIVVIKAQIHAGG